MSIDVHVSGAGTIANGQVHEESSVVARCSLCAREVEASAAIGASAFACAACLRERLDALSVARFRLQPPKSLPWGKVTS